MSKRIQLSSELSKVLIDLNPEEGKLTNQLKKLCETRNAVAISLIAPYAGVRVSPIEMRTAHVGLSEEIAIEEVLNEFSKCTKCKKLLLLINSPGGFVHSSYKVARALRTYFDEIIAYVPHVAASGGTLIALAANSIYLGRMSHITPIDTQVFYRETYVSAYSMSKALSRLSDFFKNILPEEAPYPWRAMADKLDSTIMEEWNTHLKEMAVYLFELMGMAGYTSNEITKITDRLVFSELPHGYVIHKDRAKKLGLHLAPDNKEKKAFEIMRAWLKEYMLKSSDKHIIRYVIPEGGKNEDQKNKKRKRSGK